MKNAIPVFYAADNNYALPLSVSIISVLENTTSDIHFYILENKIAEENKKAINNLKEKYSNFEISWLSVDIKKFKNFPNLQWYSLNMYSRFLIPEICPQLDKVIYLDVDIIFRSDIKKLYEHNLADYCLGAVRGEAEIIAENRFQKHLQDLKLPSGHRYFGSGVLLINSKKWRADKIQEKLFQTIEEFKSVLKYPDQDVLNIVFNQAYSTLDNGYNRDLRCLKGDIDKNIAAISDVYLIHYDGKDKPWNIQNMAFAELFWKYAELSPFYKGLQKNCKAESTLLKAYLFFFIPLFSIMKDREQTKIYLFNKIPLVTIKRKKHKKEICLFNNVPLLKIK